MIHFIEKAFQTNINDVLIAFVDVLLRLHHALVGILRWAEAIAVLLEVKFKTGRDCLCHTLLQPTISHRWDAQQARLSIALGLLHLFYSR